MGEHLKSNDMIQHDEVNNMVSYSLESSVKVMIDRNKRRWKFLWGISCFVVILELLFLMIFRYPMDHIKSIINISGIMMIFALWGCFFAKELPTFYDEHKINYVSQGIFRIHMPGLAFNNANWPVILNVLRIFSLLSAVGTPMFYCVCISLGGFQLFNDIKIYVLWGIILLLIATVYYIGKKYE